MNDDHGFKKVSTAVPSKMRFRDAFKTLPTLRCIVVGPSRSGKTSFIEQALKAAGAKDNAKCWAPNPRGQTELVQKTLTGRDCTFVDTPDVTARSDMWQQTLAAIQHDTAKNGGVIVCMLSMEVLNKPESETRLLRDRLRLLHVLLVGLRMVYVIRVQTRDQVHDATARLTKLQQAMAADDVAQGWPEIKGDLVMHYLSEVSGVDEPYSITAIVKALRYLPAGFCVKTGGRTWSPKILKEVVLENEGCTRRETPAVTLDAANLRVPARDTKERCVFIGMTGSGKTFLTERLLVWVGASREDPKLPMQDNGFASATTECTSFTVSGSNTMYVDTPGFYDTQRDQRLDNFQHIVNDLAANGGLVVVMMDFMRLKLEDMISMHRQLMALSMLANRKPNVFLVRAPLNVNTEPASTFTPAEFDTWLAACHPALEESLAVAAKRCGDAAIPVDWCLAYDASAPPEHPGSVASVADKLSQLRHEAYLPAQITSLASAILIDETHRPGLNDQQALWERKRQLIDDTLSKINAAGQKVVDGLARVDLKRGQKKDLCEQFAQGWYQSLLAVHRGTAAVGGNVWRRQLLKKREQCAAEEKRLAELRARTPDLVVGGQIFLDTLKRLVDPPVFSAGTNACT